MSYCISAPTVFDTISDVEEVTHLRSELKKSRESNEKLEKENQRLREILAKIHISILKKENVLPDVPVDSSVCGRV